MHALQWEALLICLYDKIHVAEEENSSTDKLVITLKGLDKITLLVKIMFLKTLLLLKDSQCCPFGNTFLVFNYTM